MSAGLLGWSLLRTIVACGGVLFVAGSLGLACLDYAGEDYGVEACPAADGEGDAGAETPGSGSGSGEAEPDCEEVAGPPSAGSGSGSGAMQ